MPSAVKVRQRPKTSLSANTPRLWEFNDCVRLLAWLDYCIENGQNFQDTIVDLLKIEVNKVFTFQQVGNKLVDFRRGGPGRPARSMIKGTSRLAEVLEKGTSCLPILAPGDSSLENAVKQQLSIYRKAPPKLPMPGTSEGLQIRKEATNAREKEVHNLPSDTLNPRDPNLEENSPAREQEETSPNVEWEQSYNAAVETTNRLLWQKNEEIRLIREQWGKETDSLYQKRTELIIKNEQLQAQVQAHTFACNDRESKNNDGIVQILCNQRNLISSYLRRIHEAEEGARFASRDPEDTRDKVISEIKTFVDNIQSELESIMHSHESHTVLKILRIEKQSDLASLLHSVFGNDIDVLRRLRICIMKFGIVLVVRLLTLAAIRDWVFMTDYDMSEFYVEEDSLLNAYRQEVMFQGGWKTLRELEKAAFLRVANQTSHSEVKVPRVASVLAARLSNSLAPFFTRDLNGYETIEFNSWGENTAVWNDRRNCFKSVFELALKFKTFTATTDIRYGFFINDPGSISVSVHHETESERFGQGTSSVGSSHRTIASLCVLGPVMNEAQTQTVDSAIIQKTNFEKLRPAENVAIYRESIVIPIDPPRHTHLNGMQSSLPSTPTSTGEEELSDPEYSPSPSGRVRDPTPSPLESDTAVAQQTEQTSDGHYRKGIPTGRADVGPNYTRNDTLTPSSTKVSKNTSSNPKIRQDKEHRLSCSRCHKIFTTVSSRNRHENTVTCTVDQHNSMAHLGHHFESDIILDQSRDNPDTHLAGPEEIQSGRGHTDQIQQTEESGAERQQTSFTERNSSPTELSTIGGSISNRQLITEQEQHSEITDREASANPDLSLEGVASAHSLQSHSSTGGTGVLDGISSPMNETNPISPANKRRRLSTTQNPSSYSTVERTGLSGAVLSGARSLMGRP